MKGKIARRLARYVGRNDANLGQTAGRVTFTFDDAYSSACTLGADLIEQAGGRATFYVCGGLDQSQTGDPKYHSGEELRNLQDRGHEVACHGFGHLNYQETSPDAIRRDLDRNADYFSDNRLQAPRNFAYPYGCVSPRAKSICAQRFRSLRGVQSSANRSKVDLALLKSVPLYSNTLKQADVTALLESTRGQGGWLIFFGHDVTDTPNQFDMTPELLEWALSETVRCKLPLMTMDAALDHYGL